MNRVWDKCEGALLWVMLTLLPKIVGLGSTVCLVLAGIEAFRDHDLMMATVWVFWAIVLAKVYTVMEHPWRE